MVTFPMTLKDPNPVFKVTAFLSQLSQKRCILGTKLLMNTNRKPYTIYRVISLSMTVDPNFKVTTFEVEYREDKVTIPQWETIPNIWNGTMFGDLD